MRGKIEETSINESSSNSNQQTIQSNPYEKRDANEQQVIQERVPEVPPPPYVTVEQPSNPKPRSENVTQNSSINNQNIQGIPAPQIHITERHSIDIMCPTCGVIVHTRVETISTIVTIGLAIILLFFCLCLCVIPFLLPFCKRTTHYCPNCHRILGKVDEFQ